jgi:LysM repeat protein
MHGMRVVALGFLASLLLVGCGRLLPPPTPTRQAVAPVTATSSPIPTATRRATYTPVPATPSDTPTPTVTPTPIIYVIKQGDILGTIARQFGVSVQDLQDVNGITDPRRLRIGQELIIPPQEFEGEPTPVPTPTPLPLRIQGLAFHWTPADSLWCLGEVLNLASQPAEEVLVQVSLHDEQGTLLAAGAAFSQLDILAGGGRSPFAILFPAPPSSFAQYQARVLSGVPSTHLGPRYPDLAVVGNQGDWAGDNFRVQGEVRNVGQADAERVAVVITLYDAEERVVAARSVGIAADLFLAGAIAPFDVTLTPLGPVARYDVQVQGWWIGYQIPEASDTPQATASP